eukprot:gene14167-biopygen23254
MLLVAEVLGVKPHDEAVDAFALIEGAMNAMDIKSMLPSLAHHVEIAEVDKELNRGDQILVRTAGRNEVFHHGIFIGRLPGVLEDKNLVVDFWGPPKEGKHGARIRLRTLTEFITMPRQRAAQLAVMRWKRDTQDLREFTATLALTLHKDLKDCSGLYHLLNSNCSHFATWCRTLRAMDPPTHEQVAKMQNCYWDVLEENAELKTSVLEKDEIIARLRRQLNTANHKSLMFFAGQSMQGAVGVTLAMQTIPAGLWRPRARSAR